MQLAVQFKSRLSTLRAVHLEPYSDSDMDLRNLNLGFGHGHEIFQHFGHGLGQRHDFGHGHVRKSRTRTIFVSNFEMVVRLEIDVYEI